MPLTDITIRNIKPREKPYKLADEKGLFLLITPAGGKWWRFKYRFDGKEKLLSIGVYPDVTLAKAREKRDEARKLLVDSIDPGENRRAIKASRADSAANSFEVVAREWFTKNVSIWALTHADKIIRRLERDIFPWLGAKPISIITAPDILGTLRRIEERGALDTAHRAQQNCSQIFRYAVATGRATKQETNHASNHHNLCYLLPSYSSHASSRRKNISPYYPQPYRRLIFKNR